MIKKRRAAAGILGLAVTAMISGVTVMAETTVQEPVFSIVTDKEAYTGAESIIESVKIQNGTGDAMYNITIRGDIPDGYRTEDGASDEWTARIESISAGAEGEAGETLIPKETTEPGGGETTEPGGGETTEPGGGETTEPGGGETTEPGGGETTEPGGEVDTGDRAQFLPWAVAAAACICIIVLLIALRNRRKGRRFLSLLLVCAMAGTLLPGTALPAKAAEPEGDTLIEQSADVSKTITVDGKEVTLTAEITYQTETKEQEPEEDTSLSYEGYELKWEDQFDGETLNRADWNVELHDPGWVNNELQSYVDSTDNIYVKDGSLVIKPTETEDENGNKSYASGRVNTQNKHDFKYGLFEARVKVPEGQGFLPAFWMMPTNENLYGQWPRCGEIDIMEVLGNDTHTSYGTIHYGNPHSESQGSYTLEEGTFSDEYHVFNVEWEPGRISWYVDGRLIHTEDNWYSATEGQGEITYPAPFDQVEEVILRDPDANGNYVVNGDFSVNEDLTDDKDWTFLTTLGGVAEASVKNNEIVVSTTDDGTVDYSVQLVQPNLPMKQGGVYQVSFDAYADEARSMKVGVSAPDRSYRRYLEDTTVDLTTEKKTYTLDFTMTDSDDANGRLEFNMGATGSTAGIHISNVSLKKTKEIEITEGDKGILADGNYVYNGSFQEGEGRLAYWEITKNDGAEVSVTNENNVRRLMINAPEGTSSENPVVISQSDLALSAGNTYAMSFTAEGEAGKYIKVRTCGQDFTAELNGAAAEYDYTLAMNTEPSDTNIAFYIEAPGVYYIDDVRIEEDSLIKNGSFNAGFSGYEPYVDSSISSDVTYVVDSLSEDNAADFSISNTGDAAWKIQLKQNNVELEQGQWYRLSLDAKSSIDRKLMFAIQRDGSSDDDWTPYSGEKIVDLGQDYNTYEIEFQMTAQTDPKAVLSISMGAVGGDQITEKHRICIDNINLEKIEAPEVSEQPDGENMLTNGDFAEGIDGWENAVTRPGEADVSFENGKAVYNIKNVGTEDWNVQLKQSGLVLEEGAYYRVSFKVKSSEARTIKLAMLSPSYDWYGGQDIALEKDQEEEVSINFKMDKPTDTNTTMVISMGAIAGIDTPLSVIELSEFSLVKVKN